MKRFASILSTVVLAAVTSLSAALPAQDDVFTIGIYSPPEHNLVSRDYIFTALPFYEEVNLKPYDAPPRDYPSNRDSFSQAGAIVMKDKSVLFFQTRSAGYLEVHDASNRSTLYRLRKSPGAKLRCPRPEKDLADMGFPKPDEVFCVAMFPWNKGKQFSAETLVEALPTFRLLTKDDVPALASPSQMGNTTRILYGPAEWTTPEGRRAEVLNGVIVMKNRTVFQWITWTPTAIAFPNWRYGSYYVVDRK